MQNIIYITHGGRTLSLTQWAAETGISAVTLRKRYHTAIEKGADMDSIFAPVRPHSTPKSRAAAKNRENAAMRNWYGEKNTRTCGECPHLTARSGGGFGCERYDGGATEWDTQSAACALAGTTETDGPPLINREVIPAVVKQIIAASRKTEMQRGGS